MFLKMLQIRNPKLVEVIFDYHQRGLILDNTIVLDLDTIKQNAMYLSHYASRHELRPFLTIKSFGLNPIVAKAAIASGFHGVVCLSVREVQVCVTNQLPIGIIQFSTEIPEALMMRIMNYGAEYFSVDSILKAQKINYLSANLAHKQKIILNIINSDLETSQEKGINLAQLKVAVEAIRAMPNIIIAGLAAFPCWRYSTITHQNIPTEKINLLSEAKQILISLGIDVSILSMPFANSVGLTKNMAAAGATVFEAGHSLLGTTLAHAENSDLFEIPAVAYTSGISYHHNGYSYFYHGSSNKYAIFRTLIGRSMANSEICSVNEFDMNSADYYLNAPSHFSQGDTVISCCEMPSLIIKSNVLVLGGVQSCVDSPKILGVFTTLGDKVDFNLV